MLGIAAAVVMGVAFLIYATGTVVDRVISPMSLLLLGLTLLAAHLAGVGSSYSVPRRRSRR